MSLDDSRDITDTTQWFSEVSDEFEVTNHYEQSVWNNFWWKSFPKSWENINSI